MMHHQPFQYSNIPHIYLSSAFQIIPATTSSSPSSNIAPEQYFLCLSFSFLLLLPERMMTMPSHTAAFCLIFLLAVSTLSYATPSGSLRVGFYHTSCPKAEAIVRGVVSKALSQNPRLGAGLIRMHFHDCFVRGCDASVLLDPTAANPTEKENPANHKSLQGFKLIDEIKSEIEAACPKTVSCADIVAFAARDSALKLGGIKYLVPSGRRDGRISLKDEPTKFLPSPLFDVQQLQNSFAVKGLSLQDMVVLSGAHSIGMSHCSLVSNRLYAFNSTHPQDPSMDPKFATYLKSKCPSLSSTSNPTVPLDVATPNRLDNKYYQDVQCHRGLLTSDQTLMTNPSTATMVNNFVQQGGLWAHKFAEAMVRMGSIEVLTGTQGEIRQNCRVTN